MTSETYYSNFWEALGHAIGPSIIIVATLASSAFVSWVRKPAKRKPRPFDVTIADNTEIDIILEEARKRLAALRAYLVRIHNGDVFMDKACIFKMSRTNERVRPGISRQMQDRNDAVHDIVISLMTEEMALVLEDGPSWTRVVDLPECRFRRLLESGGAVATARVGIFKHGQPVAFVGIDFDYDTEPVEMASLVQDAYRIDGIISR